MATDSSAPTDQQLPQEQTREDAAPETPAESDRSGYVQPAVDVAALTALLDGEYAEVRDLVRTNLAAYASILEEAETLDRAAFRERVKEVVVEMAATSTAGWT